MSRLERRITLPILSILIANSIVGSGIFFMPALAASIAGNASILAWILASLLSLYLASAFGELASRFPEAGGIYEYAKQTLSRFLSFLVGWGALIGSNITIVMFIVAGIQYLNPNLSITLKTLIGIGFIIVFNLLAYMGLRTSMIVLTILGFVPIISLIALTIPSVKFFTLEKLFPILTHPITYVGYALFLIADVFFGWESASYLSEEVKNPKKTIPRAMIIGTGLVVVLVLLFIIITIGSVGWQELASFKRPFSELASRYFNSNIAVVFTMLAYLSIIGSAADWIVSSPRLVLAMARDKLMISQLAEIHKKRNVPHKAIFFQAVVSTILVLLASAHYRTLVETLLPLTFLLYTILMVSLIISRKNSKKGFKAPFGIVGPITVILINIAILTAWFVSSPNSGFIVTNLLLFISLGIPLYFLLDVYYNPNFAHRLSNSTARLNLAFEAITLPNSVKQFIINLFGSLKGLNVLELGSGVGGLTIALAKKATHVTAIDMSENDIEIAKHRAESHNLKNIDFIYDTHMTTRIIPNIGLFDRVYSVGMISYFQDLKRMAKHVESVLKDGGKICFVEYVDFFRILPNPAHIKNLKKLKRIFEDQGISVEITKKKGLLWNYLIIYGVKTKEPVPVI